MQILALLRRILSAGRIFLWMIAFFPDAMASQVQWNPQPTKVYATPEIINRDKEVTHASYLRGGDGGYTITFSHTGRVGTFWATTWAKMLALCPAAAGIRFDQDTDILVYDEQSEQWKSTSYRQE